MLTKHLEFTYTMVWSVALANVVGAGLCFALSGYLAKLSTVRYTLLLPSIMAIVFVGAFQGSGSWGDLYVLLLFGLIGWAMKPSLGREIVLDALLMALLRRKPKQPVLVHSDQGSQYGSDDWRRFCQAHQLEPSMRRRGNCWDNAVAESFFSSLKKERIRKRIYKTRDLARADAFDYIEVFYNRTRRHSHLGGISPKAFEQAAA